MGSTPRKSTMDQPSSEAEYEESSGNTPESGSETVTAAREDADVSPNGTESASADRHVDITYQAHGTSGTATRVNAATLPWRTTVDVPLGQEPTISIVLGEKGGQARCPLFIRGQHVQNGTTTGVFGRATCAGQLPHQDPRES
ncbi:hypothetical protein [Streptomyces sp. NPDC056190]|uniref:hypothetical protein n=1 Tax=unclassified Streptomyces TaxID=2593676 RepID=UPI0035DD5283